jgi:hypothetical protein
MPWEDELTVQWMIRLRVDLKCVGWFVQRISQTKTLGKSFTGTRQTSAWMPTTGANQICFEAGLTVDGSGVGGGIRG